MCFFVGGLRRSEQLYNSLVSQTSASMMTVSVASLLIPAAFHATFQSADLDETTTLKISRASSIILLLVYFSYLFFQLKTHSYLYDETQTADGDSSEEPEVAEITPLVAVCLLLASTGVVAVCAEFLVSSIDEMVASSGVSTTFIGLIVLPIVGNAAEHVTAVTVAYKNKMDLAIGVAVGSSMVSSPSFYRTPCAT